MHTLQREVSSKGTSLALLQDQARGGKAWPCFACMLACTSELSSADACTRSSKHAARKHRMQVRLPDVQTCLVLLHGALPVCDCPLQLAAAKRDAASQQEAGTTALAAAQEQHAAECSRLQAAAATAQAAAEHAAGEAAALRQRRMHEMGQLEARFTALVATKDRTIASLTEQLQELHAAVS